MQAVVLVLLLGLSLCGVHGSEEQFTPDVLSMVKELQTKVQTLENRDQTLQTKVQTLQSEVQTLENQNQALKTSVAQLQNSPRVAFFADFETNRVIMRPSDVATPLKYNNVVTNVGNGYNSSSGIFTAPLRGLYVFHVSAYANVLKPPFGPVLKKNGEALANPLVLCVTGKRAASTRVAVVTLETGDAVFMELRAKGSFTDDIGQSNSFSGFLLAPM